MAARMPFIMPDGTRMTTFLGDDKRSDVKRRGSKPKKSRDTRFDLSNLSNASGFRSDAERQELAAADKLGARRKLRYLNDRLLRELAGPMDAQHMAGLFSPAPFGESRPSALQTALAETPQLWDMFRNIDMDKQSRVLQRWEQHVEDQRSGGSSRPVTDSCAGRAVAGWQQMGRKHRLALLKIDVERVQEMEDDVRALAILDAGEIVLHSADPFERLAMHGLATYYGLNSHSTHTPSGKAVRFAHCAPSATPTPSAQPPPSPTPGAQTADARADALSPRDSVHSHVTVTAQDAGSPQAPAYDSDGSEGFVNLAFAADPVDSAHAGSPGASARAEAAAASGAGPESGEHEGFVPIHHPGSWHDEAAQAGSGSPAGCEAAGDVGGGLKVEAAVNSGPVLPFSVLDVVTLLKGAETQPRLTPGLLETHWREHVPPDYVLV